MTISTNIEDGSGSSNKAKVTNRGQLVTGPIDFSRAYSVDVDTINTAFNFVPPIAGKRFVITDILLYANRNVGVNDATVEIYEATGATVTTVSTSILLAEMLKQSSRDITGINLIVSEGRWINIKTDDNSIFATVMGYYVDA